MNYTKNAAKCKQCADIIESTYRHDFVTCKCGAISVDGGSDYCKRSGEPSNFLRVSDEEVEKFNKNIEVKTGRAKNLEIKGNKKLSEMVETIKQESLFEDRQGEPPWITDCGCGEHSARIYRDHVVGFNGKWWRAECAFNASKVKYQQALHLLKEMTNQFSDSKNLVYTESKEFLDKNYASAFEEMESGN